MDGVKHINFQSDFLLLLRFNGGRPDYPWQIAFFTGSTQPENFYRIGFDGTEYTPNCGPMSGTDDYLRVEFNNHNLGTGELQYELREQAPDALFSDGQRDVDGFVVLENVVLWDGVTDDVVLPIEVEVVVMRAIKGDAGADGFTPTIVVAEQTETAYRLRITNQDGAFETPNLKDARELLQYTGGRTDAVMSQKATTLGISNGIFETYSLSQTYTDEAIAALPDVTLLLQEKVDKVAGLGLSTNDYTHSDKQHVSLLASGGSPEKYLGEDGTYHSLKGCLAFPKNAQGADLFAVSGTTAAFCASMLAAGVEAGQTYSGVVSLTDMPVTGSTGMMVDILAGPSGELELYLELMSATVSPYSWSGVFCEQFSGWEKAIIGDIVHLGEEVGVGIYPGGDCPPTVTKAYVDNSIRQAIYDSWGGAY